MKFPAQIGSKYRHRKLSKYFEYEMSSNYSCCDLRDPSKVQSEATGSLGGIEMSLANWFRMSGQGALEKAPCAGDQKSVRIDRNNLSDDKTETILAPRTEPAACQSRNFTTSPPAAVGSFSRSVKKNLLTSYAALGILAITLTGCTNSVGASPSTSLDNDQQALNSQLLLDPTIKAPETIEPSEQLGEASSASPTKASAEPSKVPKDAAPQPKVSNAPASEPTEVPSETQPHTAVAYEVEDGIVPPVIRPNSQISAEDKSVASVTKSGNEATFTDGLSVTVQKDSQGSVKSEGPGYFTGAPYVVFSITLDNQSQEDIDLSHVVITAMTGKAKNVALPLYGEAEVFDFSGTLSNGDKTTAKYAFMVPGGVTSVALQVDLDASHAPVIVTSKIVVA